MVVVAAAEATVVWRSFHSRRETGVVVLLQRRPRDEVEAERTRGTR